MAIIELIGHSSNVVLPAYASEICIHIYMAIDDVLAFAGKTQCEQILKPLRCGTYCGPWFEHVSAQSLFCKSGLTCRSRHDHNRNFRGYIKCLTAKYFTASGIDFKRKH